MTVPSLLPNTKASSNANLLITKPIVLRNGWNALSRVEASSSDWKGHVESISDLARTQATPELQVHDVGKLLAQDTAKLVDETLVETSISEAPFRLPQGNGDFYRYYFTYYSRFPAFYRVDGVL